MELAALVLRRLARVSRLTVRRQSAARSMAFVGQMRRTVELDAILYTETVGLLCRAQVSAHPCLSRLLPTRLPAPPFLSRCLNLSARLLRPQHHPFTLAHQLRSQHCLFPPALLLRPALPLLSLLQAILHLWPLPPHQLLARSCLPLRPLIRQQSTPRLCWHPRHPAATGLPPSLSLTALPPPLQRTFTSRPLPWHTAPPHLPQPPSPSRTSPPSQSPRHR
jgi:hypothetical protein